jgi:nucleoside-diphosphate-sugar epimerase
LWSCKSEKDIHSYVIGLLDGSGVSITLSNNADVCSSEAVATLLRKQPGFTRFRVMSVCCTRYFDIRKARKVLGYEPIVDLAEGVTRACKVRPFQPTNIVSRSLIL